MMFPLLLTRGEALAHTASFAADAGARLLHDAGMPPFVAGRPLFLHRLADATTACLGRVTAAADDTVTFPWALREPLDGTARLFQPALALVIPPHLDPLLHVEYQLGLVERATAAGSHVTIEREQVVELLRLRLPAPPQRVLDDLLAFARALRADGSLACTLVDGRGAVRRVTLADESIELHPQAFRPGDPFDLLLRVDAESVHV